jgi:transcriptional regulator with XRE-family HTH domain
MLGTLRYRLDDDLGTVIREARRFADLSQADLAAVIGTTQSAVSRWERGHESPRPESLVTILRACGYEADLVLRPRDMGVDRGQIRAMLATTPEGRLASSANTSKFLAKARSGRTARP